MTEQELREKLEKKKRTLSTEMGNRHANPIIRSTYPSKSREVMSGEFAQLYSLGFKDCSELLIKALMALEFYVNKDNWTNNEDFGPHSSPYEDAIVKDSDTDYIGGKRASQAMQEIMKEIEG